MTTHGTRSTRAFESPAAPVTSRFRCALGAALLAGIVLAMTPTEATAQVRGFADVGRTTFTASKTFNTILGTDSGVVVGGGAEVDLPYRLFVALRASQFRKDGQRVFLFDGQAFNLGVDTTITVIPVELSAGYRFNVHARVIPYAGGGVSWYRYRETSAFATAEENVSETFTGYHLLGGIEFKVARFVGAAVEGSWARVADSIGQDPNAVSTAFDEDDLGGVTVRVKVVIGR